ncbi:hypothetical protein [Streptomyces sp. SYSU K217416]
MIAAALVLLVLAGWLMLGFYVSHDQTSDRCADGTGSPQRVECVSRG